MKNANIKILASLCWALAVTNVHGAYYNPSNEYDSYYDNQRYSDNDYTPHNYASKKNRSPIVPNDIGFFVGLETSLISYSQAKGTVQNSDYKEKYTTTSINYKPFDNAYLSFGVDSDNGFRFALNVKHYKVRTKIMDNPEADTTLNVFGGALDIPFVKLESTSPFLRFGAAYMFRHNESIEIKTPAFNVGLGVAHNFSKNVFGILVAQYAVMPKAKLGTSMSENAAYYTENGFLLNLGLGYRF
jgi:hypothetical protein